MIVGQTRDLFPQVGGFGVAGDAVGLIAFEAGDVQAHRVELEDLREQLPGHLDGAALEVVAEGPVAQHFEEGVMPARSPDVVEIVVLAAGADAFLRVGNALPRGLLGAEEIGLELVHPGVGKQQRRVIVRHDGRGPDEGVAVLLDEEVDVSLADLGGRHRHSVRIIREPMR